MIISYRKTPTSPSPTLIKGTEIEIVESYKYLGVTIDNKLSFDSHISSTSKKVQQRLFFLRKMRSFNVSNVMMTLFYRSFIESVLTFCIVAWYGNLTLTNKNRLSSLVKVASKISGRTQAQLIDLYKRQMLKRASSLLEVTDHPLRPEFELLPSGRRFRVPTTKTNRYKQSFVPAAIQLLNKK